MPGLVPGIHVLATKQGVDGRDKPGHDDGRFGASGNSSCDDQRLLTPVFDLLEPHQHLAGRHDVAELLDDIFQRAAMFVVG